MGNPFQVKLSQMLSAANTDLPRLEALLYLCCSHASLALSVYSEALRSAVYHPPRTGRGFPARRDSEAGNSLIFIPLKDVQHPFSFYFGAG